MQQEPRARITWKKPESVQTFPVEVRTMEEVQLLLEMAPEVKTAGENTLDLPSSHFIISFQDLLLAKPTQGPGKWSFQGSALKCRAVQGKRVWMKWS